MKLGDIETSRHTNDLFSALKQGHATLQQLQKEVTVADVERLMDDNAEAKMFQVKSHLSTMQVAIFETK